MIVRPSFIEAAVQKRSTSSVAHHLLVNYQRAHIAIIKAQFTSKRMRDGMSVRVPRAAFPLPFRSQTMHFAGAVHVTTEEHPLILHSAQGVYAFAPWSLHTGNSWGNNWAHCFPLHHIAQTCVACICSWPHAAQRLSLHGCNSLSRTASSRNTAGFPSIGLLERGHSARRGCYKLLRRAA